METMELFYPEISVSVGSYIFTEGVELEVCSDQASYFDWGKVKFTDRFQEKITVTKRDEANFKLGYDGVFDSVLEGYVSRDYNGGAMDEIVVKDAMLLLEETRITNTFLQTTPQEMAEYCLAQAGVTGFKLFDNIFPSKPVVPISKKTVIQVFTEIAGIWRIKDKFFFSGGVFYWGVKPEQEKVYTFEYAVNILNLERADGVWEMETVSAPFVKHSHIIEVIHPRVSGEFEVKKVTFTTNGTGFIRTVINF